MSLHAKDHAPIKIKDLCTPIKTTYLNIHPEFFRSLVALIHYARLEELLNDTR